MQNLYYATNKEKTWESTKALITRTSDKILYKLDVKYGQKALHLETRLPTTLFCQYTKIARAKE